MYDPEHNVTSLPRKQLRRNRRPERAAVNAVRTLLEDAGLVVQEVEMGNDYGKDLLVDITENDEITGEAIALQIKGGKLFKVRDGWHIPATQKDIRLWRESTIPIFGIVHDPDSRTLRWINLTEYVRGRPRHQHSVA